MREDFSSEGKLPQGKKLKLISNENVVSFYSLQNSDLAFLELIHTWWRKLNENHNWDLFWYHEETIAWIKSTFISIFPWNNDSFQKTFQAQVKVFDPSSKQI